MDAERVELREIADEDALRIAEFFTAELNGRVVPAKWLSLLSPPWDATGPNHGYQLLVDDRVVGAYAAVYSHRDIAGKEVAICNLGAFCVLEGYRAHSIRLIRAVLGQRDFEFTDLSPSGNVVALNERLGFVRLDTATRLAVNLPALAQRDVTVSSDPARLAATLRDPDAQIYADHRRAPASRHLLVTSADEYGYLIFRKDRRKGIPVFATPLYAGGSSALLRRAWPTIGSQLLTKHGALATLAEQRVLGFAPPRSRELTAPRVKMFRSARLSADQIDYLYSELTLVEW